MAFHATYNDTPRLVLLRVWSLENNNNMKMRNTKRRVYVSWPHYANHRVDTNYAGFNVLSSDTFSIDSNLNNKKIKTLMQYQCLFVCLVS